MKIIKLIAFVSMIVTLIFSIGVAPDPYCLSKPLYKQFPLVQQQILTHDMDDSFSGYNLNIQLTSNNSFVTLSKKFKELDRRNTYLPSIISHYMEHKDNGMGKDSFILYKDFTGSIHFNYGIIRSKNSLPQLNSTAIVTSQKNIQCFDAALFLDHGLAIIDCLRVNPTNKIQPFTNIFYYLDLVSHTIVKKVQNDVYVNFKSITQRKLLKFTQSQTFYPYLVRAYYSDGVQLSSDNTYLQLFGAADPFDLQPFGVVDRTFIHQPKFAINDVVAYNGDLFVLDSYLGLIRLKIIKDHRILIHGLYRQTGMHKFDIYSDDLDEQLIIALSNSHNVYEISWGNSLKPQVVNKYSLMSDSIVKDIKINEEYLIVQSKSKALNSTNQQIQIDYTWIFTKGSRTYMNAYFIINHNSSNVQIDFDASQNNIYTADESGLGMYKIDEARLNLHFINQSMIGKSEEIVITATSTDPNTKKVVNCTQVMKVFFTAKEDPRIFQTGYQMTKLYSTNYPGSLKIPLDGRFMGPNITYNVDHLQSHQIPKFWIDKVNSTIFQINFNIKPQDITFFHSDILPQSRRDQLVYYFQDTKNKTYVAQCIYATQDRTVACGLQKQYQHQSRIAAFTTAYFVNYQSWDYFYIMVLEGLRNQVTLIDFVRHKIVAKIDYEGHQQAQVHHVASSNGNLYVLRKNVKTIDVYSLAQCKKNNHCKLQFSIDPSSLKHLGIEYFSPQNIITDRMHPQVLFIKCLGSVLVLDVDNKAKIHVLDQIISPATKDFYFRIAVNQYRMILSASPNIIEQYSLQRVYQKDSLTLMKNYPLYGYKIQPNADIQFSDKQFLVYVNAFDPKFGVSVVLVYRSGYPSSAVLYDVIYLDQLYSRPGFQIQVSGNKIDYLSIAAGNQFKVYRVFEEPALNILNVFDNYTLNIQAKNSASTLQTDRINVTVVNYPQGFTPTLQFNSTLNNLKFQSHGNYTWDDKQWFKGHVINYNYTCLQCNTNSSVKNPKVKVRQHIDSFNMLQIGGNDYIQTLTGGIAVHQDLIMYQHNGSVKSIINLPDQKILQTCLKVAAFQTGQFVVTACNVLGAGVNLYMTSLQSFKSLTWGPYMTDAQFVQTFQVVHDVVMIVDQTAYPGITNRPGSVFLYRVSVNPDTLQEFDLLDQITNDDLLAAHGWNKENAVIANAHLTYSFQSNTFRLYITELNNGFFIIDFTRHQYENQIHVLSISYVDMNQVLKKFYFHMPNDASFQAITFTNMIYHPNQYLQNVLITTNKYHNFQITIIYDNSSKIQGTIIHRVYYRYGFYQTYNSVKFIAGYVAIGYILPSMYIIHTDYKRQYIAVYDTLDYPHESEKGYSERYILGAYSLQHRQPAVFAFNKTYDHHSNGSRIGLIVSQTSQHYMTSMSLSRTIQIELKQGFKGQKLNITAFNDFKQFNFNVKIIENQFNDQDTYLFIIILSIAGILTIFFICYLCKVHDQKKRANKIPESRQSLITQTQSFINDTISKQSQYQPPILNNTQTNMIKQDSGYSSDSEEQQSEKNNTQIKSPILTLEQKPINIKKQNIQSGQNNIKISQNQKENIKQISKQSFNTVQIISEKNESEKKQQPKNEQIIKQEKNQRQNQQIPQTIKLEEVNEQQKQQQIIAQNIPQNQ